MNSADKLPATGIAGIAGFAGSPAGRTVVLMLGAAGVVGVMAAVWMWSRQPDYRILFANFTDRDGGAIVASLQQMNVPYKYAEGGAAILVPAEQVHDARLKLAAQGLPKGGIVGFELMENQKLGISQFLEQINFQRALEGELARSIQSVAAVQGARIHLALPKSSVFVRDQQKPTASVLLNLHPGRTLDRQQVSAMVHLIASSVPDLPAKNVTVVDQEGNLLSEPSEGTKSNGLDPSQLKYVHQLQQSIVKRVESIITPLVGAGNVRAEATADIDFSQSEQAAESYKPNQGTNQPAVRSQQTSETSNSAGAGGVPGALSNQAPAPATAPLTAAPAAAGAAASSNSQRDSTTNYELDKTIRYVQHPMGGIKRLSVAVVVNYRSKAGKDGKPAALPLTDAEKNQISDLVKEAMGFNKERGDSINVVNSPFVGVEKEVLPELALWQRPALIDMARETGKYLIAAIMLGWLYFSLLRPLLRKISAGIAPSPAVAAEPAEEDAIVHLKAASLQAPEERKPDHLETARQLARDDPKIVANIVKSWVDRNE
jgi:flagellar M-ring protein FliF